MTRIIAACDVILSIGKMLKITVIIFLYKTKVPQNKVTNIAYDGIVGY